MARPSRPSLSVLVLLFTAAGAVWAGCGVDERSLISLAATEGAPADASVDASKDVGVDVARDVTTDLAPEAKADAPLEAAPDTGGSCDPTHCAAIIPFDPIVVACCTDTAQCGTKFALVPGSPCITFDGGFGGVGGFAGGP